MISFSAWQICHEQCSPCPGFERLHGMIPVEMIGYTDFRPEPYFLTLGPYDFYWFELQHRGV